MRIDLNPEAGGVLIEGTTEELDVLSDSVIYAMEHGETADALLTEHGVETVTIRCVGDSDEQQEGGSVDWRFVGEWAMAWIEQIGEPPDPRTDRDDWEKYMIARQIVAPEEGE